MISSGGRYFRLGKSNSADYHRLGKSINSFTNIIERALNRHTQTQEAPVLVDLNLLEGSDHRHSEISLCWGMNTDIRPRKEKLFQRA